MLYATDLWKKTHQGASVGCMIIENMPNLESCEELENYKRRLETDLRAIFISKQQLSGHFPITVYSDYYKQYKKTYHVLQQMESIVFTAREIPHVAGLVEAMFMAELKNGLFRNIC